MLVGFITAIILCNKNVIRKEYLNNFMKRLKRRINKIVVWMVFCMVLSGCNAKKEDVTSNLYKEGLNVVEKMDLMAESEEYINLVLSAPELKVVVNDIGEKDYSKPDTVYQITIAENTIKSVITQVNGAESDMSEIILPDIYRRFLRAIPTSLNAIDGTVSIAATSVLIGESDFICEGLTENTMYLYLYENAYSVLVLFSPMEDNIVRATGNFIIKEGFSEALSESQIKEQLIATGYLLDCEIQEVEIQ